MFMFLFGDEGCITSIMTSNSNSNTNTTTSTPATSASIPLDLTSSSSAPRSHNRRYLCAAPRPDQYDEHASPVLQRLGRTRASRKTLLEATLRALQTRHNLERKTGPGRKSNAEHAIHFYEYLLELVENGEEEGEDIGDADSISSASNKDEAEHERNVESVNKNTLKDENNATEAQEDSVKSELDEASSMDTATFVKAHNDLCEVCDEAGDLLMCETCNLVFHVACVRPALETLPEQDYKCAYCVLSTEPKNSRPRKQAAAAVRLMARLRNQFQRNKRRGRNDAGDSKRDNEDEDQIVSSDLGDKPSEASGNEEISKLEPSAGTDEEKSSEEEKDKTNDTKDTTKEIADPRKVTEDRTNIEEATPLASNKRRKLELYRITDAFSTPENMEDGRSKRNRKQPMLYDPQAGPARKWQSDEPKYWNSDSQSDNSISGESETRDADEKDAFGTVVKKVGSARKENGEIHCSFCEDDPFIELCCFCGCRVCFGKHHQSKLLLCDECDDEYHTFCLSPPLKSLPASNAEWFCPSCSVSQQRRQITTKSLSSRIGTRGAMSKSPSPTRISSRQAATKASHSTSLTEHVKRGPGRPRSKDRILTVAVGKKRGRPPKSASQGSPDKKRAKTEPTTKLSSQTPKSDDGKARSKSLVGAVSDHDPVTDYISATAPIQEVKISRSGRPVKRGSFHDEIEQREQHLRSDRSHPISPSKAITNQTSSTPATIPAEIIEASTIADSESDSLKATKTTSVLQGSQQASANATALENASPSPVFSEPASPPAPMNNKASKVSVKVSVSNPTPNVQPSVRINTVPSIATIPPMVEPTPVSVPPTAMKPVSAPMSSSTSTSLPTTGQSTLLSPSKISDPAPATNNVEPAAVISTAAITTAKAAVPQPLTASASVPPPIAQNKEVKVPRRKPGARECMQISRRFGVRAIPQKYMDIMTDYCKRGKVEHLIRMRERLDDHSRFLEAQLAGLEALVLEKGESSVVVPSMPSGPDRKLERTLGTEYDL